LSIKKNQYNDAQNQMEKTKIKRKSPSPTLGGTIDHFGKKFQKQKVRKQALMILNLEIFKHLFKLANIIFFITKSSSLHYVPNQALSDQRQGFWIVWQCFLM